MSGLEINKMVAAVLTAGIVASFSGFVSYLLINPEMPAENAFPVAVFEENETDMAEADDGAEQQSALALLASADVAAGEKAVKKCTACHTLDQGGANKIGPNLWNIVGRDIASAGGYSYSSDLEGKSGDSWTYENLDGFLHKPKEWAPGTKMSFAGLKKVQERADLIAYLRSLSDSPAPLPDVEAAPAEAESGEAPAEAESGEAPTDTQTAKAPADTETQAPKDAAAEADSVLSLLASADEAAGKKAVRKCTACHTLDQGGANKIGPNLWNIVGRQIASAGGYKYSDGLQKMSGDSWSYENLDGYLHKPKDWAPGTKMSFAGVKKEQERADLIVYLRSLSDSPAPLPE